MLKNFLFLISLVCSLAHAEVTWPGKPAELQISGFVYATMFQDQDWQNDHYVAATNIDYDFGRWAVRSQISTYKEDPVRRLVLEYSHPITRSLEATYQVGRFARLETFVDGVTNNPGVTGLAVMPMAAYNYKMFNGSFVLMDGVSGKLTYSDGHDGLWSVRYKVGKMVIPEQHSIQMEAFRQEPSGTNKVRLDPRNDSRDIGFHYENNQWHLYLAQNTYQLTTVNLGGSAFAQNVANTYQHIDYRIARAGAKWDNQKYWVQTEWSHDTTKYTNNLGVTTPGTNAFNNNLYIGKYLGDNWNVYYGISYGHNKTARTFNRDKLIGVTWNKGDWTVSTEFHSGLGNSWRKYDAPKVAAPDLPSWNSLVTSITYRF